MPNRYARSRVGAARPRPPRPRGARGQQVEQRRRPTTSRTTASASGRRAVSASATPRTKRRSEPRARPGRARTGARPRARRTGRRRSAGAPRPRLGRGAGGRGSPPSAAARSERGHRAEADLQAPHPVGRDAGHLLERRRPAEVQARLEHAPIPPNRWSSPTSPGRSPSSRWWRRSGNRSTHRAGKDSPASAPDPSPRLGRDRAGRRAVRSSRRIGGAAGTAAARPSRRRRAAASR